MIKTYERKHLKVQFKDKDIIEKRPMKLTNKICIAGHNMDIWV